MTNLNNVSLRGLSPINTKMKIEDAALQINIIEASIHYLNTKINSGELNKYELKRKQKILKNELMLFEQYKK